MVELIDVCMNTLFDVLSIRQQYTHISSETCFLTFSLSNFKTFKVSSCSSWNVAHRKLSVQTIRTSASNSK